jgi:hypothetical protein
MSMPVTCCRLYANDTGESHFQEFSLETNAVQYAPPAPAFDVTAPLPASSAFFVRFPEGWDDRAHPSPRRQLFIVLEGEIEGSTGLGQSHIFRIGDHVLLEDTHGKGHGARPLKGEALAMIIALE